MPIGRRPFLSLSLAAVTAALLIAALAGTVAGAAAAGCPRPKIDTANGCVSRATARAQIQAMTRKAMPELGIRAAIVRVDTVGKPLTSFAMGSSMAGVPANTHMHWRVGSMAIPYLINLTLQLQDEGKLSLDDKLSKYFPGYPEADQVTLRMLAGVRSGYPDWAQENPAFVNQLYANPFRQYKPSELLQIAFSQPIPCAPTTCFHYAHTNFAILSQVISKATGKPTGTLIQRRVLDPLGLHQVQISRYPAMPGPVLHAYLADRGPYEDVTFWSPSWSIGAGTVMNGTVADMTRTARLIGNGALISRSAYRQMSAPLSAGLGIFNDKLYYGLGILFDHGWQFQNPQIDGYTGIMAYLPARDLSLSIVNTYRSSSTPNDATLATTLFQQLAHYLAPGHPVTL